MHALSIELSFNLVHELKLCVAVELTGLEIDEHERIERDNIECSLGNYSVAKCFRFLNVYRRVSHVIKVIFTFCVFDTMRL